MARLRKAESQLGGVGGRSSFSFYPRILVQPLLIDPPGLSEPREIRDLELAVGGLAGENGRANRCPMGERVVDRRHPASPIVYS